MAMPDVDVLFAAIISPAQRLGVFDKVNGHEPKSAPASGITCSYWLDWFGPVPARSGLDRTTMGLVIQARIQTSMLAEPADGIDPALLRAAAALVSAYHGDFDLSTTPGLPDCELDLLGAWYTGGLVARAGYIHQDSTQYRAMILSIPVTINDAFVQVR